MNPLLSVRDLGVKLVDGRKQSVVLENISFDVGQCEIFCIVGESGSGKSMTAKSLMGLLPGGARTSGHAQFADGDLLVKAHAHASRGRNIGMIFQEPMTALTPVLSIGKQMCEASIIVGGMTPEDAQIRALELLESVGIEGGQSRLDQYPHELSGGMRQRVMIAMAMMQAPQLMIADEPTTALDVTVQAQILSLLKMLVHDRGMGLILITHDMGVVAEMADRVLVMKQGRTVESASVHSLFHAPIHDYTRELLAAVPRLDIEPSAVVSKADGAKDRVPQDPIVQIENVSKRFVAHAGFMRKGLSTHALDDVSLHLDRGETLAIVGESGSGKSTLGRAVARLQDIDAGRILVDGQDISLLKGSVLRHARGRTQMVFQDPWSSLDPRFTAGRTIAEPMLIRGMTRSEAGERALALLERVGLSASMYRRYPHEFSGGQRQRIAIARALATGPSVLVADEPTSALDVSVQANVLALLKELKTEHSLAMLFISHDLAVVRQVSDRIAVMRAGRILESGQTDAVLAAPRHPYTRALINSAPILEPDKRDRKLQVDIPLPGVMVGPLQEIEPGHWVAT
ncbi:MAG: dipeptide ABC transporter ATP-binding protein [Granulosicoccus sp.]